MTSTVSPQWISSESRASVRIYNGAEISVPCYNESDRKKQPGKSKAEGGGVGQATMGMNMLAISVVVENGGCGRGADRAKARNWC